MAAPSLNKPAMQRIPQLQSDKASKMAGKLLRRPRAPKRQAHSPERMESKMATGFQLDQLRPLADYNVTETATQPSPAPSRAYSLVSPPPPSEATHKKSICYDYADFDHPMQKRGIAFITKEDKKYVLDSIYREKTMTAASQPGEEGRSRQRTASDPRASGLLRPVKGRGPDPLPARPPRQRPEVVPDFSDFTDDARYYRPPDFTLENFLVDVAEVQDIPLMRVKRAVYSKHNYNKIIKLLGAKLCPQATKVNQVTLSAEGVGIPRKESRIPQRQLLVELAAVIKQHVRDTMNTEVKSIIRPLPKYTPGFGTGSAPHTEIVLYEDTATAVSEQLTQEKQSTEAPTQDSVFSAPRSAYFQGAPRSGTPFLAEAVISPSEVAVLDALVSGGIALSLKAHFICRLPDVSPLTSTVTYLNLSFNDFTFVPPEVVELSQLEVLKLRNNPLTTLPDDINKLSNLRVLVASFCLIDTLPDSLWSLENLVHLNLAYNRLTSLPDDIGKLGSLREMTVEGNQLPAMPRGALRLRALSLLNVRNNFMHPLFWKDYTQDQPQSLLDLTSLALHKHGLLGNMDSLPEAIKTKLSRCGTCDSCKGPIFGPGMRIIRPVQKIFCIKYLPFMFRACSSQCKSEFLKKTNVLSEFRNAEK